MSICVKHAGRVLGCCAAILVPGAMGGCAQSSAGRPSSDGVAAVAAPAAVVTQVDEAIVKLHLYMVAHADGTTEVRWNVRQSQESLRVGRPESATDQAARAIEDARNAKIVEKLNVLHTRDGLSDEVTVVLHADKTVLYADVLKVLEACTTARFAKVALAPASAG